ncbi:MAG: TolC family protein, partial [Alphaproteobacteria bacterium]|nr:TolC family protein [Alphaproteobacteria bacterium]
MYRDPQFDRLMEQALAGNPSLAEALARLRQAQAQAAGSSAGLWPHAALNAQETRQKFSGDDLYPPPFGGNVFWQGA